MSAKSLVKSANCSVPSPDRLTSAAFWVTAIADALAAEQLDVPGLFRDASLDIAALGDPDARFATDQVSLLWELAIARSGNPTVGLAGASRARPGHFGIVAYTLMSAPDLLGILQRMVRYVAIVIIQLPRSRLHLVAHPASAAPRMPSYSLTPMSRGLCRQRMIACPLSTIGSRLNIYI